MTPNSGYLIGRRLHSGILSAVAATGIGASPALAQATDPYNWGPHMWGGWFFGPFTMIAVVVLIALLIALFVRWLGGSVGGGGDRGQSAKSALDILRERFARGEIDKDEFEERKRALGA